LGDCFVDCVTVGCEAMGSFGGGWVSVGGGEGGVAASLLFGDGRFVFFGEGGEMIFECQDFFAEG